MKLEPNWTYYTYNSSNLIASTKFFSALELVFRIQNINLKGKISFDFTINLLFNRILGQIENLNLVSVENSDLVQFGKTWIWLYPKN